MIILPQINEFVKEGTGMTHVQARAAAAAQVKVTVTMRGSFPCECKCSRIAEVGECFDERGVATPYVICIGELGNVSYRVSPEDVSLR